MIDVIFKDSDRQIYMNQIIKLLTLTTILIVFQFSNIAAQTSPEIERLTAEIARNPKYDSLYAERGLLYT